jgi:hypothetical protein
MRLRAALERGEAAAATRDCLDGLAIARDEAIGGGLVGRMVGTAIVAKLRSPCAAAVTSLADAERRAAMSRLRALRDAIPGLDALMREESAWMQLYIRAPDLSPARAEALLPRPRVILADGRRYPNPAGWRVLHTATWTIRRVRYEKLIRAAALPPAQRDAILDQPGWKLVDALAPDSASFQRYFRRADVAIQQLDLVVLAAAAKTYRERHGAWPADGAALLADDLVTEAEQRRTGAIVRLASAEDGALALELPVQRLSDTEPARAFTLRVGP